MIDRMKTAFLFSGQGAQYPGMMKELFNKYDCCKKILQVADEVTGRSLTELIFEGDPEELKITKNTQPAVLAADLMAYEAAKKVNIGFDAVAGYSLGEYAALTAAGVFDFETVFRIIEIRAKAMNDAVDIGVGGMAAVMKLSGVEVQALCDEVEGYVIPVNFNCPGQTTVSGDMVAIDSLIALAKSRKIRAMKLPVSVPCHCKYMESAAEALAECFDRIKFNKPKIPVYMNVDGLPETDPGKIREKLIKQVKESVQWLKTLEEMKQDGVEAFVELGPGKTLTTFVKRTFPESVYLNIENCELLEKAVEILK